MCTSAQLGAIHECKTSVRFFVRITDISYTAVQQTKFKYIGEPFYIGPMENREIIDNFCLQALLVNIEGDRQTDRFSLFNEGSRFRQIGHQTITCENFCACSVIQKRDYPIGETPEYCCYQIRL